MLHSCQSSRCSSFCTSSSSASSSPHVLLRLLLSLQHSHKHSRRWQRSLRAAGGSGARLFQVGFSFLRLRDCRMFNTVCLLSDCGVCVYLSSAHGCTLTQTASWKYNNCMNWKTAAGAEEGDLLYHRLH